MIERPVFAHRPRIVALGGNATAGGSAERLLRHALDRCEAEGAETLLFAGKSATVATLRSVTLALRGWPTPMAVMANSSQQLFDSDGTLTDCGINQQLDIMTRQLVIFTQMKASLTVAMTA